MANTPKPGVVSVNDRLPPVGERLIVVCKDSRCLGYLDRHGTWRDDVHKQEFQDVIGWVDDWSDDASSEKQTPSP